MADRTRPNLRLTDEARDGFDRFCTTERVTLTALVEALGLELAAGRRAIATSVVERAAAIDRQRKSRR